MSFAPGLKLPGTAPSPYHLSVTRPRHSGVMEKSILRSGHRSFPIHVTALNGGNHP